MTIIVYRDGVMASDTGADQGGMSHRWVTKIARSPDGVLYGVAGSAAECCKFLAWARAGEGEMPKPRDVDNGGNSFIVLIARPAGVSLLTAYGEEVYRSETPYMATGSAKECAMGALWMNASAEQAVRACLEHGCGAFGDVDMIRF